MSRRAIKRYEEVLEADRLKGEDLSHQANDVSIDDVVQRRNHHQAGAQSLFALLEGEGSSFGSDEDVNSSTPEGSAYDHVESTDTKESDAGEKQREAAVDDGTEDAPEDDCGPAEAQVNKKKKKKKRRGKKRQNNSNKHETDPDWIALNAADVGATPRVEGETPGWIPSSYFVKEDSESTREEATRIMAMIEAMAVAENPEDVHSGPAADLEGSTLLHVETRLLNADSELKRLFGSRVIESERRIEDATAASTSRRRGRVGRRAHLRRKVSLVSPRENWVAEAPGLAMVLDTEATEKAESGVRYYRYVHEGSYARLQEEYRVLVGTHDPNMLVGFASRYPYHVDTLLQLAEIYRQMGELDMAAEQIERSLYVLENSWTLAFKPFDGNCRLRFDVMENRSLYVSLFRYSQLLTRRGLHRTALEIAKLLLNFDPENDPMGMLMLSDSFALLSGEYKWILDMRNDFDFIPIRYFPNFATSAAIARESMRLGLSGISTRGSTSRGRNVVENGKREEGVVVDESSAEYLLTDALLTYPMILKPLLSAIEDNSGAWMEHRLYDESWYGAGYDDAGVLLRMARVYAERTKLIWNSADNKHLLIRCARAAGELDTAAGSGVDPSTGRPSSAFVRNASEHERVARCRALRSEAGDWLRSSGLYREVQIADFADSTTNLPAELLAGEGADQAVGATPPRARSLTENAMEFVQSLLPWRDIQDAQ